METVLICPGERPGVSFLSQAVPLVSVPILGENLVTCWVEWLANRGTKDILLLVTDRPDIVRAVVGDGSRWGVRIKVEALLHEPTASEVRAREAVRAGGTGNGESAEVIELEHLPGLENVPLLRSYRDWYEGVLAWMARLPAFNRIGAREIKPGIWCGRRTQIAPTARLLAPCWLGEHVQVGANAVIGPNVVVEDRVVIDSAAEITSSMVGPETYVGALTRLDGSIAWGNTLIDWRSSSCTQVPDPFLLSALGQSFLPQGQSPGKRSGTQDLRSWLKRPWAFMARLPARLRG